MGSTFKAMAGGFINWIIKFPRCYKTTIVICNKEIILARSIVMRALTLVQVWLWTWPGASLFQAFWSSTGPFFRSVQIWRENPMTPPTPLPTLAGPIRLRIRCFKVGLSKIFWGRTPTPPSYKVVTFMHVALLALFLVLATTLRAFQAFRSSVRQTPAIHIQNPANSYVLK